MAYLLMVTISAALFFAGLSLHRYGNIKKQHPLVTLSVLTAWTFSFLIVFTLPLDITATVYRKCMQDQQPHDDINHTGNGSSTEIPPLSCQKPWGMVPNYIFPNLWRVTYWTSQFLTWLIMPLMQSYLKAGDFHFKGKLKSAFIDNAIYYGSYFFICVILLIYIAFRGISLDWQKLKAIASSASNTWGLFLLILLLGYALVEVPRNLWNRSNPLFTLQHAYFKVAKLSTEKAEAEENVDDNLESVQAVSRAVPSNHELRPYIETILQKIPKELMENFSRSPQRPGEETVLTVVPSMRTLIRIHKHVIKSLQTLQRMRALWSVNVEEAFHLEDIARNMNSADRTFKTEFPRKSGRLHRIFYSPAVDWYWQCQLKYPLFKLLAVITGSLSFMVVWSELTFFNRDPVLSIFANVLNAASYRYDFFTIEVFSMLILCYLCYCAYSTVFRIKFLNLYYLAPHHQTNEHSLIFSGMMLCRLTPPMCLNFLGLVHMDSHIIKKRLLETYYTQIMGHMDVIGIISDGFNIYFPMCMLAFCLATWFSVGRRILNTLGFQQFLLNEPFSTELVQEGKDLIAREKRRRQRAEDALRRKHAPSNGSNMTPHSSKYRSFQYEAPLTPSDGLLRDAETFDYSSHDHLDITRSLSEEINDRFGISTQMHVGFVSSGGSTAAGNNAEDESQRIDPRIRGIFDDV